MNDKDKEEEAAAAVEAFIREEVVDWDDETKSRARFKALSGQRSDWEPLYLFWRDLILKVARHRRIFIIRPSDVKRLWFRRGGVSPLCLDRVLLEMHRAGDLSPLHPTSAATRLSRIFRRALDFLGASDEDEHALAGDCYILAPLLEVCYFNFPTSFFLLTVALLNFTVGSLYTGASQWSSQQVVGKSLDFFLRCHYEKVWGYMYGINGSSCNFELLVCTGQSKTPHHQQSWSNRGSFHFWVLVLMILYILEY